MTRVTLIMIKPPFPLVNETHGTLKLKNSMYVSTSI